MPSVRVPQPDGRIRISNGGQAHEWPVVDHLLDVAPDDVEHILRFVDGAVVVDAEEEPSIRPARRARTARSNP